MQSKEEAAPEQQRVPLGLPLGAAEASPTAVSFHAHDVVTVTRPSHTLQVPAGTAISYADTVQLAGAAAAISTGLPKDALWKPLPVGRVDSPPLSQTAAASTDDTALLPPANLDFGQVSHGR